MISFFAKLPDKSIKIGFLFLLSAILSWLAAFAIVIAFPKFGEDNVFPSLIIIFGLSMTGFVLAISGLMKYFFRFLDAGHKRIDKMSATLDELFVTMNN